jgi:hypothetical protein
MTEAEPASKARRDASAARGSRRVTAAATVAGALAFAGLANTLAARRAERQNPPPGASWRSVASAFTMSPWAMVRRSSSCTATAA